MDQHFPLHTQIGTFKDKEELNVWIKNYPIKEIGLDYGYFVKCSDAIYTDKILDVVDRYLAYSNFNITSFNNDYDSMPDYLIEGYIIINNELSRINEYLTRRNGNKKIRS